MEDNQDEFQAALADEFELDKPDVEEEKPVEDTPSEEDKPDEVKEDKPTDEDKPADEVKKEETPVVEEEAPKFATKQDMIDAMREYNSETTGRIDKVSVASKEIIEKLHPEGIDQNIYDTNGDVIKTAQDIVDRGLVNQRTNEPFTYDEAASFMLEAGKTNAANLEELNKYATDIAEKNISLVEENERVMQKYGDLIEAMPNVAKQIAEKYISTQLQFDPTGSYITGMVTSPEEFYGLMMAPYRELSQSLAAKEVEQAQTDQSEQSERNGIPGQRGQADMPSNTGDAMVDALIDEMNKG